MGLARSIKRRSREAAPAVVFLSLVAYFAWNATRGDLGLRAYARRNADLVAATQSLTAAQTERDAWQQRVASMQPGHLDSDALDERARQLLNLSEPSDIVIPAKN
jgi:cell division protein FtsB